MERKAVVFKLVIVFCHFLRLIYLKKVKNLHMLNFVSKKLINRKLTKLHIDLRKLNNLAREYFKKLKMHLNSFS